MAIAAWAADRVDARRNLFAGFIITQPNMVPWWRWYFYANPIAWTLYGVVVTQLGQDTTVVRAVNSTRDPSLPISSFFKVHIGAGLLFAAAIAPAAMMRQAC